MADLPPEDRRRLHEALLAAFPNRDDLAELVTFAFNTPIDSVAAPGVSNTTAVLEILQWAEARGRLGALLDEAARQRPDNQALQSIVVSVRVSVEGGATPSVLPPPSSSPTPPPGSGKGQPPGGGGEPPAPQPGSYVKVVLAFAGVIIAAVLALVFTRDTITPAQWGVAKPVLAVACAVIAAYLPGALHVELGSWLRAGGALAVFAVVLLLPVPPPEPDATTFTGYVFFKGTNSPVRGAVVVYAANNLKSNATGGDGFFSLPGVPASVRELSWEYGKQSETFPITQVTGGRYAVIPRAVRPVSTSPVVVPASQWATLTHACPRSGAETHTQAVHLRVAIPALEGAAAALIRVIATDDAVRIAQVLDVTPDSAVTVVTAVDVVRARQWEFAPVPAAGLDAGLTLCLSGTAGPINPATALRTEYWYRKFE